MSSWDPDGDEGFGDEEIPVFDEVSELQGSVREQIQEDGEEQVQEENDVFGSVAENTQEIRDDAIPLPLQDSASEGSDRLFRMPNNEFPKREFKRGSYVCKEGVKAVNT